MKMSTDITTQIQPAESLKVVEAGFGNTDSFALSQRVATALSKSTLIPKDYQNNLPNCLVALNMANRLGADPLMVMQNLYVVHGRPAWSSQFLIATANASGKFSPLRYRTIGTQGKDDYGCICHAVCNQTGEVLESVPITIGMAKAEGWYSKNGSKWQTMPDQMLRYRAASFFVRSYAPELSLGIHTEHEVADIIDGESRSLNRVTIQKVELPAIEGPAE
jgi:hypothetical protein